MPITLKPITEYGEKMTLDEFQQAVDDGSFIDYDGWGYYATDDQESNVKVHPSDVIGGIPDHRRELFTHVIWFNR